MDSILISNFMFYSLDYSPHNTNARYWASSVKSSFVSDITDKSVYHKDILVVKIQMVSLIYDKEIKFYGYYYLLTYDHGNHKADFSYLSRYYVSINTLEVQNFRQVS